MMLPPKVRRSTKAGVGEGLGPAGDGLVGGDGDAALSFSFGQDLEEEFGAAAVEFHVAELVDAQKIDSAVAGDGLGQLFLVGGIDELVDEFRRQDVLDPIASHRGLGAQCDQQVGLSGAGVPDAAEGQALLVPFAFGEGADHRRVEIEIGVEVELAQRLVAGNPAA
jgi:hypothetical protein